MQTPLRGRGANNTKPTEDSATVTPPPARNNGATNVQSKEEGRTNIEEQPAIDVEATTGNKQEGAVDGNSPAKVAAAKTAASLRNIKEKKTSARTKQSTINFAGSTARMTPAGRVDKAAARKTTAARTQTMINQKEKFIQYEAKAIPALAPKQAARDHIGTLMEKLGGIIILSLKGDVGVVRNKGTLPGDWNTGLNKYVAI